MMKIKPHDPVVQLGHLWLILLLHLAILLQRDDLVILVVPEDVFEGMGNVTQSDLVQVTEQVAKLLVAFLQIVVGDQRREMVDMMVGNIRGEPIHNPRQG